MPSKEEIIKELKTYAYECSAEELFGDDFKGVFRTIIKGKVINFYAIIHDIDLLILWHDKNDNLDYILGEEVGL